MNIFNCLNPSPAVWSSVAVRIFREKSHLVSQVESEMKMSTYIYIYTHKYLTIHIYIYDVRVCLGVVL